MLNFPGFTMEKWCEAASTVTMVDNILVHKQASSPPYKMFYEQDAKYAKHLSTFSEMCVTTDTSNKVGRLKVNTRG